MKTRLVILTIGSSLLLAEPSLRAEDQPAPSTLPSRRATREQLMKVHPMMPFELADLLNLTDDQMAKIYPIEEGFMKAQKEYVVFHKEEIDAAQAATKAAWQSKDEEKKRAAIEQMKKVMAGLEIQRKAAVDQVKSLLTDQQKEIFEEKARDPSGLRRGVRALKP